MTDRTTDRLRDALGGLAGDVGAPRRVDADSVFRQARVTRRRRSAVAACAALLVTAGLAGTALAAGLGGGGHSSGPPAGASPAGSAPAASAPASPPPASTSGTPAAPSSSQSSFSSPPPTAATTAGLPPGTALTRHTGDLAIRTDGTVIDGWDLTGSLDIYADNVTIRNSRITSANWWGINQRDGYTGLTILHSTITGVAGPGRDYGVRGGAGLEVGWCDISRFANPVSVSAGSIHDNYLHQSGVNGLIASGGNREPLVIRRNTVLNESGGTSAIGLFADNGPVTDVVVENNVLGGGQYAFYGGGPAATRIRVTGNRFTTTVSPRGGVQGPVAAWNGGGAGNVWRDNVWGDGRPLSPW